MLSPLTMVGRLISTENPVVCIHFLFPLSIISLIFFCPSIREGGVTLLDNESPKAHGAVARALGMIGDN